METFAWEYEPVPVKDVVAEVKRLAEEQPEHIYFQPSGAATCQYTHRDGTPGCIVGHALAALGRQIPYEHGWNTATGVDGLSWEGLIIGESYWLQRVQCHQDDGMEWGTAVEQADADVLDKELEGFSYDDGDL